MRAWARWVAAALLIALALTGGPDALDISPPVSHAQAAGGDPSEPGEPGDKRDPQVRDDALESPHHIVDRGTHGHLRPAALPPSPQTAAPVPVRGASQATPPGLPSAVTGVSDPSRPGACAPEALQIFRC